MLVRFARRHGQQERMLLLSIGSPFLLCDETNSPPPVRLLGTAASRPTLPAPFAH